MIGKLILCLPSNIKLAAKRVPLISYIYFNIISKRKSGYDFWIKNIEDKMWCKAINSNKKLKFSIVVPIYNPPLELLKSCVFSVKNQTYKDWELILVNDKSTFPEVNQYLNDMDRNSIDSNVKIIFNSTNKHISLSTNEGIKRASGDFMLFLDHDDLLAPLALNEIATVLEKSPQLQWVYSDEDLMTENGKRVVPHFKSQWNPYLLRSHNYITHLCAYRRELLEELGGFRVGFEGAQDYDLALRASRVLQPYQIGHIPKVLYHWRMHSQSTAASSTAKPYTHVAGKKALQEHLDAIGVKATVDDGVSDNFYKVNYLLDVWPKVSIIIPTRNNKSLLEACITSIFDKTNYSDFEVIIMDNQSSEPDCLTYLDSVQRDSRVKVVKHDKPFNYSEINNTAVKHHASGNVVVLLNNDTEVITPQWLTEMVGLAMQPDVGCVGAKLLYADNTIQHAGVILGLGGYAAHSHRCTPNNASGYFHRPNLTQVLSAVTGACLAIKKELYLQMNGLDEAFQIAYNDVDFCLRVQQAGYLNVYCPHAELYHYESKTRGDDNLDPVKAARFDQEKQRLRDRWEAVIENDPYYNPNLTRSAENFAINMES